jgi:hypothetical protein
MIVFCPEPFTCNVLPNYTYFYATDMWWLTKKVVIYPLDLRSPAMLWSVDWSLITDDSGQSIGPIFKGQAVPGPAILEGRFCLAAQ